MQHDHPLTLTYVLDRMRTINGTSEVVTLTTEGTERASYAEVGARIDRLCGGLTKLGVQPGERVGTFAWNSQQHLELYLGVPCMGAVLHTLNFRMSPEQIAYVVNHAQDAVIVVDDVLVPLLAPVVSALESVRHFVVIGSGDATGLRDVVRYEELLAAQGDGFDYPELDDRSAAGLCYTGGTTGNPKGVLYSHRSNVLQSVTECMPDLLCLSGHDRVLPIVPMFHANAWGLPYCCALTGADMIMPRNFMAPDRLAALIEAERPTIAGAVPTVWMDLLRYADEHHPDLSSLRTVLCGGSAVPPSLMRDFEERHGAEVVQCWGMTEMSPLGAVARPPRDAAGEERWAYRSRAGRLAALVDARVVDEDGGELPWDDEATGELQVRGPWIASAYYREDTPDKFSDGWLRTGDIVSIDPRGFIRIRDRSKDVIKSGGEWISSVDLENEIMAHPGIAEAAVIARPDERWSERPVACVVPAPGADVDPDELRARLLGVVPKFWLPDEVFVVDEVPKTAVGKFDKKLLRRRLADGDLTPAGRALA